MRRFIYIVRDYGRPNKAFPTRRAAERHRLNATCGRCKPQRTCPHYFESSTHKVGYTTGKLREVLRQERVGAKPKYR